LIILDPPAFAKKAGAVPNALRGYKEINLEAMRKIAPGGLLYSFSCSQAIDPVLFRKMLFGAAVDARRPVRLLHYLGQPADHPVDMGHPEGEYLKGWLMAVE
jgi:23S rRNA (cytosine1962-C5)-methyltransferase